MNIYDPYPDRVVVGDKEIMLDLRWDNVLRAIDILDMAEMSFPDRTEAACAFLLASPGNDTPWTAEGRVTLLNAIFEMFPKGEQTERVIDFHQDAAMIRSAFYRIGIDLLKSRIHFFQFLELLADLPKDTALMRTIDIRTRPLPKPNNDNREQIAELQRLKAKVAIKMSEEDRRRQFAESLKNSSVLRG